MTPRQKIETLRRNLDQGEFPWASEVRALLGVAEAAARHVEDYRDEEGEGCDFGSERCTACALEQALARLVAEAVERAEKDTAPAGRPGDCAACPHPGSEHLAFSGLCTADGCPCIEHEPKGGRDA